MDFFGLHLVRNPTTCLIQRNFYKFFILIISHLITLGNLEINKIYKNISHLPSKEYKNGKVKDPDLFFLGVIIDNLSTPYKFGCLASIQQLNGGGEISMAFQSS